MVKMKFCCLENGQIGKHIYDLIKNKYQTKALDKDNVTLN